MQDGCLKIKGNRHTLTPTFMQTIRSNGTALLRKSLCDQYTPPLLDLWEGDVIGPLACWLWFEVEHFPMDTRVATGLYADLALYRRIKEGIEGDSETRRICAGMMVCGHILRGLWRIRFYPPFRRSNHFVQYCTFLSRSLRRRQSGRTRSRRR